MYPDFVKTINNNKKYYDNSIQKLNAYVFACYGCDTKVWLFFQTEEHIITSCKYAYSGSILISVCLEILIDKYLLNSNVYDIDENLVLAKQDPQIVILLRDINFKTNRDLLGLMQGVRNYVYQRLC